MVAFLLVILVGLSFAFRVTQGIDEAQRAVVKAYKAGAKEKAPYLYSKAKAYKEISFLLASEVDDIGSKIFAIRTMNLASRAISASFTGIQELTPLESLPKKKRSEDFMLVDVDDLRSRLNFLRENRGMNCAPAELGRAEAFYDALVYELKKEEPNSALLLKFYNEANNESKLAESKLKVAIENDLTCYTGKKKAVAKAQEAPPPPPPEEEEKEEEPKPVEERLKITARIHFDFDKYEIKEEYIPILNEVVKTLKENDFLKVRIEGYTDIIGSKEYNEKLALKRAKAVKDYLVKHGIPEEKIEIVGFGKERFIATNETKIGRLTNRRVEFVVVRIEGEIKKKPERKEEPPKETKAEKEDMVAFAKDLVLRNLKENRQNFLTRLKTSPKVELKEDAYSVGVKLKGIDTGRCKGKVKGEPFIGLILGLEISHQKTGRSVELEGVVCGYEAEGKEEFSFLP